MAELKPTEAEFEQALREYGCRKCFGRGYVGWTRGGDPVICECAIKVRESLKRVVPLEAVKVRNS